MHSIIHEVEAEFGEPFWQVVQGFASDGHSVHAVAGLLGYASSATFRRLIQRHGVEIQFASAQDSVFQREARQLRIGRCSPAQKAATERASEANPTYKRVMYGGTLDTIAGHARRAGVPVSTARKRYRRNPDPAYVFAQGSYVSDQWKSSGPTVF